MGAWSCETPVISTACPNAHVQLSANAPLGQSKTVGPNPAPPQPAPAAIHDPRRRQLDEQQPPGRRLRLSQRLLATMEMDRTKESVPNEARAPAMSESVSGGPVGVRGAGRNTGREAPRRPCVFGANCCRAAMSCSSVPMTARRNLGKPPSTAPSPLASSKGGTQRSCPNPSEAQGSTPSASSSQKRIFFDAPARRGNMQRESSNGWSGAAGIATPADPCVSYKREWL
jgi:hypothetical protein